jgi:hypothetical protein
MSPVDQQNHGELDEATNRYKMMIGEQACVKVPCHVKKISKEL